jgi:lysophospholipase L1-like esterase
VALASPAITVSGWLSWSGERLEDDLAWLQHPELRSLNGYLADHRFRGRAVTVEKPAGTARVITLGASTTYGFAIPDGTGQEYPMVLERLLGADGAQRVEVINAAFLGATTEHQYRLLRDGLMVFQPDVVTLSLFYNDSFALTGADVAATVARSTAQGYRRSLLDDALQMFRLQQAPRRVTALTSRFREWQGSTLELWSSLELAPNEPTPPQRYEAQLRRFAELGRERGFCLVLVKEPVREAHTAWKDEFYAAVDAVAAEYGLPVVDPTPALQAAGGAALFMDVVHLRAPGLAIIAQELAPAVRECLQRERR